MRIRGLFGGKKTALLTVTVVAAVITVGGVTMALFFGGSGTPSNSSVNLQQGLVGWWKMDGNVQDSSTSGNDGTINGATLASDRYGKTNSAYNFNGSSNYVALPAGAYDSYNEGSISAWIKLSALPSSGNSYEIFSQASASDQDSLLVFGVYGLSSSDTRLKVGERLGNSFFYGSTSISSGVWYHVAMTASGSAWSLYVNGRAQTLTAIAGTNNGVFFNQEVSGTMRYDIGVADRTNGKTEYFNGSIDDVRIYDRVLNSLEISTLFEGSGIDLQRGLVGWWKLDGNAKDATPYAADGTPSGAPAAADDHKNAAGRAITLNGSGQYYALGNPSQLQITGSQTISMWLKPASFAGRQNPFCKAYGGEGCITQETSGQLNYYYGTSGGNTTPYQGFGSAENIPLNTWTHIVLVRDLTVMTLTWYINGQQDNQNTANYAAATAGGNSAYIGHGYVDSFNGTMDDVRVYNRALSSTEVEALYNTYDGGLAINSTNAGLVGWWKLDGNAKDSSPYGDNTSSNTGVLTADRKGMAGSAYSFNGAQCMTLPNTSNINIETLTLSAWIKTTQVPTTDADIIEKWAGSGDYPYTLRLQANGHPSFKAYDGTLNPGPTATVAVNDGNWHHVVGTRVKQGTIQIFVDGTLRGTATDTTTVSTTNNVALFIGCRGGSSQFFNGSVDDVRIYNRILQASEIANLYGSYNSHVTVSDLQKGLVGWWAMNGNAKDATPYGHDAVASGTPTLTVDRLRRTNSAYELDTSNYFTLGNVLSSPDSWTYSAWVYPTSGSTSVADGIVGESNNPRLTWGQPGGSNLKFHMLAAYLDNSPLTVGSLSTYSINSWHHVVAVFYNASTVSPTLTLYVDGQPAGTTTGNNTIQKPNSTHYIGVRDSSYGFPGSIDDVRIWDRALSQAEVQALYNQYN